MNPKISDLLARIQQMEQEIELEMQRKRAELQADFEQTRVRFVGAPVQRMVVPQAAVLRRGELTGVYVASDKGFSLKAVRLGADQGGAGIEVLAGLKPGDAVAVNAVQAGLLGAMPAGK